MLSIDQLLTKMPKKRELAPENHNGCIRLRFSVEGTRFSFHPLPGGKWENKKHRQICEAIATKINFDILAGNFDPSLTRYKHQAMPEGATQPLANEVARLGSKVKRRSCRFV